MSGRETATRRRAQLDDWISSQVHEHFEGDVAGAILSQPDVVTSVARLLNETYDGEPEGMDAALAAVSEDLTDRLSDWLCDNPEHAAKWLYKQL